MYDTDYLLDRLYDELKNKKVTKTNCPLPKLTRDGRKTIFENFAVFCNSCKKPINHVEDFLKREMKITTSISGNNQLIITGNYTLKDIGPHLQKYAEIYVICSSCKSTNTEVIKEDRMNYLMCNNCMCRKPI